MFLALKEMRRAKVRFALLMIAIGLLVFLILFQVTLRNGLITSFVGGVRTQSAPVLVYDTESLGELPASSISPELETQIRAVDGVAEVGKIGQAILSAAVGADKSAGEPQPITLWGYESESVGAPTDLVEGRMPAAPGEVVANSVDAEDGFTVGAKVRIIPAGAEIQIVGLVENASLFGQPTMYGSFETYETTLRAVNPDAPSIPASVIGMRPVDGVTDLELVDRVNETSTDLTARTRQSAAEDTPGISQIRTSFLLIFLLYGFVIPLVTGLFFLIITLQKAGSLTLLRAIGAPSGRLVRSLLVQVVIVTGVGITIGIAMYAPISSVRLGSIPLRFETGSVIFWSVLLLAMGVISSVVSARRVLAIDPIEATTGGGQR